MKNLYKLIYFLSFTILTHFNLYAQVPTFQDCLGAIPVCQDTFIQSNAFSGTGNYPNEITYPLSCLQSGEKNDVWYIFTVQTSDTLDFTITPNVFTDDYDWAVFDITNHSCADIAIAPLQVSCNYGGNNCCSGVTGANFHGILPIPNNGSTQQSSLVFYVIAGHTYVLNISNYTSTQGGYILDFSASSAQLYDTITPFMDSTYSILNFGDSILNVLFSENIYCNSIQPTDFTLAGPGGPYAITSVSSNNCSIGADYGREFSIQFSPPISATGNFILSEVDTVYDLCYKAPKLPYFFSINVWATGTGTINSENNLKIYPNPANDHFIIDLGNQSEKAEIVINDITGKIINSVTTTNKQNIEVNTKFFEEGIYFVKIKSNDFTMTKKLIFKK